MTPGTTKAEEKKTQTTPAQKKAENKVETKSTEPTEAKRDWLSGEIKDSHLEEIFKLIKEYEFPAEAIQETKHPSMGKMITGYNAQYIINALNEILGMNHWREYGEMKEEKPAKAYVSIYNGTFEIGNWKTRKIKKTDSEGTTIEYEEKYFDHLIRHTTYGGSRNVDHWESLKGAKTNFLKKICSYYSLGWKSYALQLDDDFASMGADKGAETPTNTKPANGTKKKATPPSKKAEAQPQPEAPKKMMSDAQIKFANKLYEEYLEKTPAGQAKTIEALISPYKVKALKELTSKQGSEFITQFKEHVNGL